MEKEALCPTWWCVLSCFCSKMRNQWCPILIKGSFWILLMVSSILSAETNSTSHSASVFGTLHDSVTNSPVSLLVNLFFFVPLFSFGVRYFYQLRGVSFSQPHSLYFCLSASVCLSSFWHLFSNKPNQKYLYINKSRSCLKAVIVGKQPNSVPYDTSKHQFFPYSHSSIVMCCIMVQCVYVNEGDRKWTSRGDETRFRPRGGSYTGASVLCVCRWVAPSNHLSERPQRDICPVTRVIQNSHTRTEIKIERSAPSYDWTNGHSVTLSEPLLDHFNHRTQGKQRTVFLM